MIEIQDYIRKLYEQTGVKLKEDDPILIELVAQQIILEELANDISILVEKIESNHIKTIDNRVKKDNIYLKNVSTEIKKMLQKKNKTMETYILCFSKKIIYSIIINIALWFILFIYLINK